MSAKLVLQQLAAAAPAAVNNSRPNKKASKARPAVASLARERRAIAKAAAALPNSAATAIQYAANVKALKYKQSSARVKSLLTKLAK